MLPLHPVQQTGERDKVLACRFGVSQNAPNGLSIQPGEDRCPRHRAQETEHSRLIGIRSQNRGGCEETQ